MPLRLRTKIYKKYYFALLAFAITLLLVWGGTWFFIHNERIIRTEKENELRAIANLKSEQISDWIRERGSDAKFFSQSKNVVSVFEKWINNKADDKTKKEIEEILKHTKESHLYLDMQLLSLEGEIVFSFIDEKLLDKFLLPFFKQCVDEKKIIFTDLNLCKQHNEIHYDIISPLINDEGKVFAVLLTRLNAKDFLFPLIQKWPTPSKTAETILLRKEGEHVLFLNNLRHRDSTALKLKRPLTDTHLTAVQAVLGYTGIFDGIDYRGVKVFADLRKIPNTNWYMVTEVDKDEMFADLKSLSIFTILFTLSLIIISIAGLSLLYNFRQKNIYRELYNSEKKLLNSQEEFRTTLYSIGDAVITTDLKGGVMHINPVAEELTGWFEDEAVGKPLGEIFNVVSEVTRENVASPVDKVLRDGTVVGLANHSLLISKTGKEIPIADSGAPIKNEDGDITGVVLVFRDQTEERKNRNELEESEKKFRSLFSTMNDGLALHELVFDKESEPVDYIILDINRKYEEILGLTREEVIGKSAKEVYGSDVAPYLELYSKVALAGKAASFETYYEPMKKYFDITVYSPEKGKFATVFQDITEKKLAKEKIEHQYNTLNGINESLKSAIFSIDREYRYTSFNSLHKIEMKTLCGADIEIGNCMPDYLPNEEEREMAKINFDKVFNGESFIFESYFGDEGLGKKYFEISHNPILNSEGKTVGAAVYARDLSDRKQMEEHLRESENKFISIFKDSPVAISIVSVDESKFMDVNEVFINITGYSREEVIGKTTVELNVFDDIKDRDEIRAIMMKEGRITGKDVKLKNKRGDVRDCMMSINMITMNGKPHFIASIEDITDRKQSEAELHQNEIKYKYLFANNPQPMWVYDNKTLKILEANNVAVNKYGYTREEFLKMTLKDIRPEEDIQRFIENVKNTTSDYNHAGEWRHKKKNGDIFDVEIISHKIDFDGKEARLVVAHDITTRKKAESELSISEQRFSKAFNSNPSAMSMSSLQNGIILDINKSFEKILGYTYDELTGESVSDFNIYENPEARNELVKELNVTGSIRDKLMQFRTKSNTMKTVILSIEKVRIFEDDYILTTFNDVTLRERAEKIREIQYNIANKVITSKSLYELFETVSDEIHKVIDSSNFFAVLYDKETDMLRAQFEKGKEDTLVNWKAEKSLTGLVVKEKKSLLLSREEIQKLGDEGKIEFIGYRAESWLGVPLKIGNKVLGAIVVQDYERKNAYDRNSLELLELVAHEISIYIDLKKAEEVANRLSKGIEQSPVCILVTDYNGTIEYVNPKFCEVTGYIQKEILGNNPKILKSGAQGPEFYKNLWVTIKSGKDWVGELHNKKKNGEMYWESAIISPIFDEGKQITHFIAIKEDITEKKIMINDLIEAKNSAEEMNKLKSSFLANMSHELRTPLNGILGFAEMMQVESQDEETRSMAQIIFNSGKRLHNTLNQILSLSSLQAEVVKLRKENVIMREVVQESYNLYKAEAQKRKLEFELNAPDIPIVLHTDRVILLNIINNLVDNAIKYTIEGSVKINLSEDENKIVIEVEDTGIGVEETNHEIIFDEFRQVSEGYSRTFEGTGLGLSICKKYINLLGGNIKLKSKHLFGSTFRIELPKVLVSSLPFKDYKSKTDGKDTKTSGFVQPKKYPDKILYIENDVENQELVIIAFKDFVNIDIANDAIEGLTMAKANKYSIILMDINLGSGMDGNEVTKILRKDSRYKDTPIIAVTAFALDGDREEFMESGCTHYISKPFEVTEMRNLIFGLLEEKAN